MDQRLLTFDRKSQDNNNNNNETTTTMAAAATFEDVLTVCGFQGTTLHYFATVGVTEEALLNYTNEDYKALLGGMRQYEFPDDWDFATEGPFVISPIGLRNLKGLQRWLVFHDIRMEQHNMDVFDEDMAALWGNRHAYLYRLTEANDKVEVAKPTVLKFMKKFKLFDNQLKVYLSQVRGMTSTTLDFLIREHDDVSDEMRMRDYDDSGTDGCYEGIDDALYDTIDFMSSLAKQDNRALYYLLQELFTGGEAEVYVKNHQRTKNGRKVYFDAKAAAMGDSAKTTDVAQATATITTTKFTGAQRNYTFDKHVSTFMNAYHELDRHDNPVAPETQVAQFLASIQDKRLEMGKPTILASQKYKTDLVACTSYLQTLLAGHTKEQAAATGRNVGAVGSGFPGKIVARHYSKEEISLFTDEQREQLSRLRREINQKKLAKKKKDRRKAAKIRTRQELEEDSSEESDEDVPADQFGRAGDKKTKKSRGKKSKN